MARSTSDQVFRHIIGAVLCLAALGIISVYWSPAVNGGLKIVSVTGPPRAILDNLFAAEWLIILISVIVHIVLAFAAMVKEAGEFVSDAVKGRGGKAPKDRSDREEKDSADGTTVPSQRTAQQKIPKPKPTPRQVKEVNFQLEGLSAIKVTWKPNADTDQVVDYEVQFRYDEPPTTKWYQWGKKWGKRWQKIKAYTDKTEYIVKDIDVTKRVQVRVAARNIYKREGDWGMSEIKVPSPTPSGATPGSEPEHTPEGEPKPDPNPQPEAKDIEGLYAAFFDAQAKAREGLKAVEDKLKAFLEINHKSFIQYQLLYASRDVSTFVGIDPRMLTQVNTARLEFKQAFASYVARELAAYVTAAQKLLEHKDFGELEAERKDEVVQAVSSGIPVDIYGGLARMMRVYKDAGEYDDNQERKPSLHPGEVL